MFYDLRENPLEMALQLFSSGSIRLANWVDLMQFATTPPVQEMCLWHPRLQADVIIRASEPNGITIEDVLYQMYEQLNASLHYEEDSCSSANSGKVFGSRAYWRIQDETMNGVTRRVEQLGFHIWFLGLAKSRRGRWEIKTAEAYHLT